jgi:hypothetical protein
MTDSESGAGDTLPTHGLTGFERSIYKLGLGNVLLAIMTIYGTKCLITTWQNAGKQNSVKTDT